MKYWIICDEHIKYMCEHRNGIAIPNEYSYMLDDRLVPDLEDDYRCYITLNDGETYEKYIFGFNNKETFEEILKANDKRVLSMLEKTNKPLYESSKITYDKYDKAVRIINILYDERCEVSGCISQNILNILKSNIDVLTEYINLNIEDRRKEKIELALENAYDIINSSTLLKLHKF